MHVDRVVVVNQDWDKAWPDMADADLCIADPPYNQGVAYADDPTRDRLSPAQYRDRTVGWLQGIRQVVRPGGTVWWVVPEPLGDMAGEVLTGIIGPRLHRIIFEEAFAQYQQHCLTQDYRFIFCHVVDGEEKSGRATHKNLVFNPDDIRIPSTRQEMGDKRADPRGRVPGQVWKMRRLQGTSKHRVDWHSTQLPPELFSRIIRGWTNKGDLVLDAFAGAGLSGIVADSEGRRAVLVDRSPTYCDRMAKRISEERGFHCPVTSGREWSKIASV